MNSLLWSVFSPFWSLIKQKDDQNGENTGKNSEDAEGCAASEDENG